MKKATLALGLSVLFFLFLILQFNCSAPTDKKEMTKDDLIARGKFLVNIGGCNDCHTPKVMSNMGPVPDSTRMLSGHPASEPGPEVDPKSTAPGKYIIATQDFTSYSGPWGVSFAANITPDSATGIGSWTVDRFIQCMRDGKYMGNGRPLLPPMPWQGIGQLSNEDLTAMFTYLQSLPPINNRVPDPIPPKGMGGMMKGK